MNKIAQGLLKKPREKRKEKREKRKEKMSNLIAGTTRLLIEDVLVKAEHLQKMHSIIFKMDKIPDHEKRRVLEYSQDINNNMAVIKNSFDVLNPRFEEKAE